jgi:uncharacterized protein YfdQ (DUF2303 family)
MTEISDAEAIIQAARESALPTKVTDADVDRAHVFVVPEGAHIEIPDLSAWRDTPTRTTGTYRFATVAAFESYVARHRREDTTVWVDPGGIVTAVIDDAGPKALGWGDHRATLTLRKTPEWIHWTTTDKTMLNQEQFAEHIETGLDEIVEPDGATMLEIAQNFHATTGAAFRSSTRLASGEQRLQYEEEVTARAGATGDMTVPTRFLLGLSPFEGEKPFRLAARLRFRIGNGKLSLGYLLDKPNAVILESLDAIVERLGKAFPNTYVGQAPS